LELLNKLRMVLVETSHPGNIGAAARAMKTMGLRDLALVAPNGYPSAEATARASGADDVLYGATVHDSLEQALGGCCYVFATTARPRELSHAEWGPREAASEAIGLTRRGKVAVVFGRERSGLSNNEVDLCQGLIRIPAASDYSSLNLASAVQIIAYELRCAVIDPSCGTASQIQERSASVQSSEIAGFDDLEGLYGHLERALVTIEYLDPKQPKKLMRRLRRLFGRVALEAPELRILRGILSAAERTARAPKTEADSE
jgi:TrmH family RNA methyltransferase